MFTQLLPLVTFALLLSSTNAVQIRKALGPYNVGVTTLMLTDTSRLDPMAPTPQNRSVQLSIHYPTKDTTSPSGIYFPDATAAAQEQALAQFGLSVPPGTLHNITTHNLVNASILHGGKDLPYILFSPGLGGIRLLYTTFAQDLASEGYIVVSIDHPYDADIVELSDGRVIRATDPFNTTESVLRTFDTRVADARFVLDSLSRGKSPIPGMKTRRITQAGFFGHSLGGATAATTAISDPRIVGAVNMDGRFQGSLIREGTNYTTPLVVMLSTGRNGTNDDSLPDVLPRFTGFRRVMHVDPTTHLTYTDGLALGKALGLEAALGGVFGTIEGGRFDKIQHTYLKAFFDMVLKGKKEKKLWKDGKSSKFPEVEIEH